ncbi:MAG TPA: TolC family protein, partial [Candidatus Eremiobacteraceae bacterium]|nr:TolC family protein [Candidatus Eremiobacteraceae bacterium]
MRWRALPLAVCLATLVRASMALAAPTPIPSVASPSIAAPLAPGYAPLAFAGLTLQQAQNDAVAQSPEVDIARATVDAASANLTAARAGFGPSLIAGYTQNPQAGATSGATVQQQALNLGVQATLLSFAQFLPLLYQAEATYRGARANAVTAERNARIRAASLYFAALR